MKTEPKIGDTVWIYIYDNLWECTVTAPAPKVDEFWQGSIGKCYQLMPKHGDINGRPDDILIQSRYFFQTAREAINDEIKHANDDIRKNKKELDLRRAVIKQLKKKRADFQRMLEQYPKSS